VAVAGSASVVLPALVPHELSFLLLPAPVAPVLAHHGFPPFRTSEHPEV
jgi:hypothetical protein